MDVWAKLKGSMNHRLKLDLNQLGKAKFRKKWCLAWGGRMMVAFSKNIPFLNIPSIEVVV